MKKLAQVLAGVWLFGVLALGIGGAWMSNGGEEQVFAAVTGVDEEEIATLEAQRKAKRDAQARARELRGAGWGSETVPYQENAGGWGRDTPQ